MIKMPYHAGRIMFKQFLESGAMNICQIDSCRLGSINEIQELSPIEVRLVIELNADPLYSNYFGVIQK